VDGGAAAKMMREKKKKKKKKKKKTLHPIEKDKPQQIQSFRNEKTPSAKNGKTGRRKGSGKKRARANTDRWWPCCTDSERRTSILEKKKMSFFFFFLFFFLLSCSSTLEERRVATITYLVLPLLLELLVPGY
jgi:hypothetical protein